MIDRSGHTDLNASPPFDKLIGPSKKDPLTNTTNGLQLNREKPANPNSQTTALSEIDDEIQLLDVAYSNTNTTAEEMPYDDIQRLVKLFPQYDLSDSDALDILSRYPGLKRKNKQLNLTDFVCLYDYKHQGFGAMNEKLRKKTAGEVDIKRAAALNHALDALPNYEGTVYRGLRSLSQDDIAKLKGEYSPPSIITHHSFTSTAKEKKDSLGGRVKFTIISHTGKDLEILENMGESEVLFKSDTTFKVLSCTEDDFGELEIQLEEYKEEPDEAKNK